MLNQDKVIILDFGSQFTQLIARRIREAGVYSEIHPCNVDPAKVKALNPQALILSGGPSSVLEGGCLIWPRNILNGACPRWASATACSFWRTSWAARLWRPRTGNTEGPSSRP